MCPRHTLLFPLIPGRGCIYLIFLHCAMCPQHTLIFPLMPGFAMQPWAKPRWKTAITRHLSCHRCIWPKPNKPINFNNFRCSCHMLINVGFSRPTFAYSLLHFFVLPKYQNPPNQQNQPIIYFNKAFLCPVRTVLQFLQCFRTEQIIKHWWISEKNCYINDVIFYVQTTDWVG